jgi:hypothetical protein
MWDVRGMGAVMLGDDVTCSLTHLHSFNCVDRVFALYNFL